MINVAEVLAQSPPDVTEEYVRGIIAARPDASVTDILSIVWDIKPASINDDKSEWRKLNNFMDELYGQISDKKKANTKST